MKKAILGLVSVALLLSACSKKLPEVKDEVTQAAVDLSQENFYLQAKKLGDVAVDFYLGRTIDSDYDIVLYDVIPLGNDYNIIPLDSVESVVDTAVRKVAGMALQMIADITTSSKDTTGKTQGTTGSEESTEMETGFEEDIESDDVNKSGDIENIDGAVSYNTGSTNVITLGYSSREGSSKALSVASMQDVKLTEKKLKEIFFPEGNVPAVEVMGTSGITQEFRRWVLITAQEAGLLDARLFDNGSGWGVYAYLCSTANGGTTFRVFDKAFTLSDAEIGELVEDIQSSPKYTMICEDYMYFDNGVYRAAYRTDPNVDVDTPVQVVVSFTYNAVSGDYDTEIEEFLAGVAHVSVQQE